MILISTSMSIYNSYVKTSASGAKKKPEQYRYGTGARRKDRFQGHPSLHIRMSGRH